MASVLPRFICDTYRLQWLDNDAKFLAVRLICREPAVRTGMSTVIRLAWSPLFRDSIRSNLGQRLSKSAEIVENGTNISQGRASILHTGSVGVILSGFPR